MKKEKKIKEYLICLLEELSKGRSGEGCEFDDSQPVGQLGMDSIAFVNFCLAIEERYEVELDEDYVDILRFYTMGDLIHYLATGEKKIIGE